MSSPSTNITSVLKETRSFPPSAEFAAQAHVKSLAEYEALFKRAADDPEGFWAEQAESLAWFKKWDTVLEWNEPFAKWFVGGKLNASYNCIDRHLEAGYAACAGKSDLRRGRTAMWFLGMDVGTGGMRAV